MSASAAAETAKVTASSPKATDVLTDASSRPANAQPRISVRFSPVESSELARSRRPRRDDLREDRQLGGVEEDAGRGDREAEHEDGRQRAVGDEGDRKHQEGPHQVRRDHQPALVEPVDGHAGERAEEDVRERVEGEDGAGAEGGARALVDEPREGERGQPVADLGDELARPEQQEAGVAVERSRAESPRRRRWLLSVFPLKRVVSCTRLWTCANAAASGRPRPRSVHQHVDDVAVRLRPPRPFRNVLSTLATLRRHVAPFVLADGVCEARLASVESAH